jgi:Xaa-Pro aminopeptidase
MADELRFRRLREAMQRERLDALVSRLPEHVLMLTGYSLGYRYHEYAPRLAPRSPDVLRAGMIHSVEPGVYDRWFGGIRIEDDVLVTDAGAEVLGPIEAELWTA